MANDITPQNNSARADSLAASDQNDQVDRFDRVYTLKAGEYWCATQDIEGSSIVEGDVLLIKSIRYADDQAHNVILHGHPGKNTGESRFLIEDFVASFVYEPRGREIRQNEIAAIQGRADAVRQDMVKTQSDRQLLIQKAEAEFGVEVDEEIEQKNRRNNNEDPSHEQNANLPALTSQEMGRIELGSALTRGYSETEVGALKLVAQREFRLARVSQKWLAARSTEMAQLIQKITPFYEEEAVAALAATEEIQEYVASLHKGIESLYLYTGKGVEVNKIKSGTGAAFDEPLHVFQKKLVMDEEFCLFADVDGSFDYSSQDEFFEALACEPRLIDQIMPVQRGIVCMAVTRRHINYGHPAMSTAKNAANHEVFLILRDGENLYEIVSPVESHLKSKRLFPSREEIDDLYGTKRSAFGGIDCSGATFKDVTYTDALEKHELAALHYRRFLIMLAGLDAREKLLGDFYPEAEQSEFITEAFQNKYFRFVEDDSLASQLGDTTMKEYPPVSEWIHQKNQALCSGSRVLCHWEALITYDSAPACFRYQSWRREYSREYSVDIDSSIEIAVRRGDDILVHVPVSGQNSKMEMRTFNAKVKLTSFVQRVDDLMGFLCLDTVTIEDIDHYLYSRNERRWHLGYVRLFKIARQYLVEQIEKEAAPRAKMREAMVAGGMDALCNVDEVIDTAVMNWRADNRGEELPGFETKKGKKAWEVLLESMYRLANKVSKDDVEAFVKEQGRELLRLVVDGKGKSRAYATLVSSERDDRLAPDQFVASFTIVPGKAGGFDMGPVSKRLMPAASAAESIQWEADGLADYVHDKPLWRRAADKPAFFSRSELGLDEGLRSLNGDWKTLAEQYLSSRAHLTEKDKKYVVSPSLAIPVGVGIRGVTPYYWVATIARPEQWLYQQAPNDTEKSWFLARYLDIYLNKTKMLLEIEKGCERSAPGNLWSIGVAGPDYSPEQGMFGAFNLRFRSALLFDGSGKTMGEIVDGEMPDGGCRLFEKVANVPSRDLGSLLNSSVDHDPQTLHWFEVRLDESADSATCHYGISLPAMTELDSPRGLLDTLLLKYAGYGLTREPFSSLERVKRKMTGRAFELNDELTKKAGFPVWGPLDNAD